MGKRKAAMSSEIAAEPKAKNHKGDDQSSDGPKRKELTEIQILRREHMKFVMQRPKMFLTMTNLGLECTASGQSPTEKHQSAGKRDKQSMRKVDTESVCEKDDESVSLKDSETPCENDRVSSGEGTETNAPQLYVRDLQYLLMYALRRGRNNPQPRWCCMLRPGKMTSVVMVVLNDVSVTDFQQHKECFSFLDGTFNQKLRVLLMNPGQYFSSFNFDLYAVPLTELQLKGFKQRNGERYCRNGRQIVFSKPANIPDYNNRENNNETPEAKTEKDKKAGSESVCRRHLLLSVQQMIEENYPLPGKKEGCEDFVMSKEKYALVTSDSPLFAVDCEMCLTSTLKHELTRVSVVNEKNEVLYDELVKPRNAIINYLTRYSGITKAMLNPVTKRIEDVQKDIRDLLPDDAVLCGHSLGGDLTALKIFHPYVIDTSVVYNLSGNRKMKCSLKRLAYSFLGRAIQESRSGHDSAEDARATMDLVKLKLSKSVKFGDAVLDGDVAPYLQSVPTTYESTEQDDRSGDQNSEKKNPVVMMRSLFDYFSYMGVSACQVGGAALVSKYQDEPELKCYEAKSDSEARKMAAQLSHQNRFTWVEFSTFADLISSEDQTNKEDAGDGLPVTETEPSVKKKRKVLKKLDEQIKKLTEKVPEKSLITVVLTGRSSRKHHEHAAAFLHIS